MLVLVLVLGADMGMDIGIGREGNNNVRARDHLGNPGRCYGRAASGYSSWESGLSREVELSWACAMLSAAVPVPV